MLNTTLARTWLRLFLHERAGGAAGLYMSKAVYDRRNRQVVLFGGTTDQTNASAASAKTWAHDGTGWFRREQVGGTPAISARFGHVMVWDSVRQTTLLFGGAASLAGPASNETWSHALGGAAWVRINPPASPPGRIHAAAGFDEARGEVVLFGGWDLSSWRNDTWTYDGTTWRQAFTVDPPPPALVGLCGAYDAGRRVFVVFGRTAAGVAVTWEWTGVTWRDRTPATSSLPRGGHGMVYDRNRGRVVLYGGGWSGIGAQADTWEWDGSVWTQRAPAFAPARREWHAMAFDEAHGHTLAFGGVIASSSVGNDAYVYLAPRCDVIGLAAPNRAPVLSCLSDPLLGGSIDVTFPNPMRAGYLLVGFAPRLQPPLPVGPPVLCSTDSLHLGPEFFAPSSQNPARVSIPIPGNTELAGLGVLLQGLVQDASGCFALTEAVATTLRAPPR